MGMNRELQRRSALREALFGVPKNSSETVSAKAKEALKDSFVYEDRFGDTVLKTRVVPMALSVLSGAVMMGVSGIDMMVSKDFEEVVTTSDVAQDVGLSPDFVRDQNSAAAFAYKGNKYLAVKDNGKIRLLVNKGEEIEGSEGFDFDFVNNTDEALFILRNVGEDMVSYSAALQETALEMLDEKPDLLSAGNITFPHFEPDSRDAEHIERDVGTINPYQFENGVVDPNVYGDFGEELIRLSSTIIDGAYGYEDLEGLEASKNVTVKIPIDMESEQAFFNAGFYLFLMGVGLPLAYGASASGVASVRQVHKNRKNARNTPKF